MTTSHVAASGMVLLLLGLSGCDGQFIDLGEPRPTDGVYNASADCGDGVQPNVREIYRFHGDQFDWNAAYSPNGCSGATQYVLEVSGSYQINRNEVTNPDDPYVTENIDYTVASVTLTPAPGQAAYLQVGCPDALLVDGVPIDVSGLDCAGIPVISIGDTHYSTLLVARDGFSAEFLANDNLIDGSSATSPDDRAGTSEDSKFIESHLQ